MVTVGDNAIVAVVGPVFQVYVVAPPAVNVVDCPTQIVAEVAVTVGKGFTIIEVVLVLLHVPLFPVTVYVVVTVGDNAIVVVVGPVFHVYVVAPPAVRVVVCPTQIVADVAVTVGKGFTVTAVVCVLEQVPLLPVTV